MAPLLLSKVFLRIGIAFTFFYAGFSSLQNPANWIGFFPVWMKDIFPESFLLPAFSIFEFLLGLWLLSGKKLFFAGIISAIVLGGIVVFNFGALDILFRDLGLFFSALALAVLARSSH